MSKRAERRHHYQRLKRKRRRYWGDFQDSGDAPRRQSGPLLGKKVSAPKPQSNCMCCMNQRKVDGETRQERAAELKELER